MGAGAGMAGAVEGSCRLTGAGTYAGYTGQGVTCTPEHDVNGKLSEGYCSMAAIEAIEDCCEGDEHCSENNPPQNCSVAWQWSKARCL